MDEPLRCHLHIRSKSLLERLDEIVRRRERLIRIFLNEAAAIRLNEAVLVDYDDIKQKKTS